MRSVVMIDGHVSVTDRILQHIHALAVDIGPRGSTSEGERKGAEYCQAEMQRIGLQPALEGFTSARSIFHPHLLGGALFLIAFAIYALGSGIGHWIAAVIVLISLASELLELGFSDNLFRRLVPKGQSQNVVGVIPPSGVHNQDLVLIGHIDTQRTPIVFSSARWVEIYKNFTTVAFVLFAIQLVLYIGGGIGEWGWVWAASIPSAVCAALLVGLCIEADMTPFTAGANDNASSVGLVLGLAEQLAAKPLEHTQVYCVCTGCEEVQHYGAIDFFKRHRGEMRAPRALVFELVGCAGPAYLEQEGIIVPFHSDPELIRTVKEIGARLPDMTAYPVSISGGNSELADCVRFGVPAITFFGLKPNGEAPYWHQVGDTFDKIDPQVIENTYRLVWETVQCLDRQAGG
jgi:hypothetical protein